MESVILLGEVKSAMGNSSASLRSWMQAQRTQLAAKGSQWRQAVSSSWTQWGQAKWESAGRGLRAAARVSGSFLTASWNGRYKTFQPASHTVDAGPVAELRPATTAVRAVAEGRPRQSISTPPIAFMRPNKFSYTSSLAVQTMPAFDAEAREQGRPNAQSSVEVGVESRAYIEAKNDIEQKLMGQLEGLIGKKCEEFSSTLDSRLDLFYEQTASKLDVLSEDIVRHSCEVLNQQIAEALSSTMEDCAKQNRALVEAECHAALDRFAARLEKISASNLESNRKQLQNISAMLKIRLRGVAHALEELGPACHRS